MKKLLTIALMLMLLIGGAKAYDGETSCGMYDCSGEKQRLDAQAYNEYNACKTNSLVGAYCVIALGADLAANDVVYLACVGARELCVYSSCVFVRETHV
jgi:hypothetical protein